MGFYSFQSLYCLTRLSAGRPRQKSVDRSCRLTCTGRARSQAGGPVDRVGRPPESFCYLEKAPVDRPINRHRVLLSVSSSGRLTDKPTREPLLSGSRPGRPSGWPVCSTVINLTVGRSTARSTGRAILPLPAANKQIHFGAIYTPFLELIWISF